MISLRERLHAEDKGACAFSMRENASFLFQEYIFVRYIYSGPSKVERFYSRTT
jgi:hypothetical protein